MTSIATKFIAACAVLAGATAIFPSQADAQALRRDVPADVRLGSLVITQPPDVTLDGKPDRLSPGARIRNTNNLLLLSGSAVGQTLPVVYRRDAAGLIHEAWVLTPQEAEKLGGVNTGDAQGYKRGLALFSADGQRFAPVVPKAGSFEASTCETTSFSSASRSHTASPPDICSLRINRSLDCTPLVPS